MPAEDMKGVVVIGVKLSETGYTLKILTYKLDAVLSLIGRMRQNRPGNAHIPPSETLDTDRCSS